MSTRSRIVRILEAALVLGGISWCVYSQAKDEVVEKDPSLESLTRSKVSSAITAGGVVFLFTDHTYSNCATPGDLLAVFAAPSGRGTPGCWHLWKGKIFSVWNDGEMEVYRPKDFQEYNYEETPFPLPPGVSHSSSAPAVPPNGLRKSPESYPERSQI